MIDLPLSLVRVLLAVVSIAAEPIGLIATREPVPAGWLRLEGRELVVHGAEAVRVEPHAERVGGWPIAVGWVVATRDEPARFILEDGGSYTVWALSFADDPLDPRRAFMVETVVVELERADKLVALLEDMRDAEAEYRDAQAELVALAPTGQELTEALRSLGGGAEQPARVPSLAPSRPTAPEPVEQGGPGPAGQADPPAGPSPRS